MTDHEARARKLTFDRDMQREIVALLRTVEREALERAAMVADNYARDGRTHKEFACETADEIAARIRSLAVKEGEG